MSQVCLLCVAERITTWVYEDDRAWVADCIVCRTPMVVWKTHGLPQPDLEGELLTLLGDVAATRYPEGHWIDGERRRIPEHWHAHARPKDGFFDPTSEHFGREWSD